jgi:hypothetical protein
MMNTLEPGMGKRYRAFVDIGNALTFLYGLLL